ncbi:long-chain-fatty-acid--CoA ligase 1 [Trichonephila clavipes]|nr:long-chain-fatty-acid--CoA ligase 1 [Trichonephila clavipes]
MRIAHLALSHWLRNFNHLHISYQTTFLPSFICIKGTNVFKGYFKNEEVTKESLRDGWQYTGDIGRWLPNGCLKIVDRKKHLFKLSQGEYIAPEKVETIYSDSELILQIFVDGNSDQNFVVALVVPEPTSLKNWLKSKGINSSENISDLLANKRLVEWAKNEIAVVPDFHKRILFSDEAHFWLNGYVSKQNCCIWSEANPQVYVETPLHPEKLTGALYGLVESFFKNDEGHNVTVNDDRYRAMITNFFIPELNNHDVQELWFQQDGATCHIARATIDLLKDTFGDRLISRFGPVNWPPRSCDLTPLDC